MPKRKQAERPELVCKTCGFDASKPSTSIGPEGWTQGPVLHCDGKSQAFNARDHGIPHHTLQLHPHCRICDADLGCPRCSGNLSELLCVGRGMSDAHWGTSAAFIEHGRLLTTDEEKREAFNFLRTAAKLVVL